MIFFEKLMLFNEYTTSLLWALSPTLIFSFSLHNVIIHNRTVNSDSRNLSLLHETRVGTLVFYMQGRTILPCQREIIDIRR